MTFLVQQWREDKHSFFSFFLSLRQIAIKYNLSYTKNNVPELCFASILDELLRKVKRENPKIIKLLNKKDKLVIVDVGCGYFRYRNALYAILKQINPSLKMFAVDKKELVYHYEPAIFLNGDVNEIASRLKNRGVEKIDIFTVFNPFPGMPDFRKLKFELGKEALLIGCVDWNPEIFKKSMKKNGFKAIVWQKNYLYEYMRPWFNSYSIFVFAISQ